jgi:uncharacterized protein (TIGR02246 family)
MRSHTIVITAVALLATGLVVHAGQRTRSSDGTAAARLQAMEDREAIRALMNDYARTLDTRDFAAFEKLWARDADLVGGGGTAAKGPEGIASYLEGQLKKNGAPVPGRDFHLVANQTIDVTGDRATALSRGIWLATNAENKLEVRIVANYHDEFVREGGTWKFKHRQIGDTPSAGRTAAR